MHGYCRRFVTFAALAVVFAWGPARAGEPEADENRSYVAPASDEGKEAIARFRIPDGFQVRLVAAEPLLANPIAFTLDERGRMYVAETFRLHKGVTDNRGHMNWLNADLAARTVEDRVAMYRKYLGEEAESYGVAEDRVRRLVDTDGDGVYDQATVFADGFDDLADGLGSGLLAWGDTVWYTNIPHLWKLVDENGDGVADVREPLSSGYGVHVAFLGHDLHGLTFGPDGKLYFTVGDRGLNVQTREGHQLTVLAQGAVLRCDPDGASLEVYATGLRNPQELAFDPHGNLFSVDNNSDGGDRARLVDLVEGGDSGWRMGYQYIESPNVRGPWNAENLWKPRSDGNEAAYLLPPLINVSDGPSGLVRDAGTGLPAKYRDHFFLADFRGASGNSGIRSFALESDGATFKMVDQSQFFWSILATDVDLAPGGGLLISDWTEGWDLTGKGRIYHLFDPKATGPEAQEVRGLLAEKLGKMSPANLAAYLGHADYRVRLAAQFRLAEQGPAALEIFASTAQNATNPLARIHSLWGLGQLEARKVENALKAVADRLDDDDEHVRSVAIRVLGNAKATDRASALIERLGDSSPRVRLLAAIALGKLRDPSAVDPLAGLIRENNNADAYLRHGAVMGLLGSADAKALDRLGSDESPAVRLAALLVHRRRGDAAASRFLKDEDPAIVLEAARAIQDAAITPALAELAAMEPSSNLGIPILRRILAANERLGGPESARRLAAISIADDLPEPVRAEALDALGTWPNPSGRDRVVGLWRPIEPRPAEPAIASLQSVVESLLKSAPASVRVSAVVAVGRLGLKDQAPTLLALVTDRGQEPRTQVAALQALESLRAEQLAEAVEAGVHAGDPEVRSEGIRLLAALDPKRALPVLETVLRDGGLREKQAAFAALGRMNAPEAETVLAGWLERLVEGDVVPAVRLDLVEAATEQGTPNLKALLEQYEASRATDSPLAAYWDALEGGDSQRGNRIFFERTEAQCIKCHKAFDQGGEVGPELTGIGGKKDRRYILQSIVEPNAEIAEGFDTLVVATDDGQVLTGVVKEESKDLLVLMDAEGKRIEIPTARIEERQRGISAMPADLLKNLSRRDVRDLVEFLSGLKEPRGNP